MAKYHVNSKTGRAGVCKATKKGCPLGAETPHFDSKKEANEYIEKTEAAGNDSLKSLSKSSSKPRPKLKELSKDFTLKINYNDVVTEGRYLGEHANTTFSKYNDRVILTKHDGSELANIRFNDRDRYALNYAMGEALSGDNYKTVKLTGDAGEKLEVTLKHNSGGDGIEFQVSKFTSPPATSPTKKAEIDDSRRNLEKLENETWELDEKFNEIYQKRLQEVAKFDAEHANDDDEAYHDAYNGLEGLKIQEEDERIAQLEGELVAREGLIEFERGRHKRLLGLRS